MIVFVVVSYST